MRIATLLAAIAPLLLLGCAVTPMEDDTGASVPEGEHGYLQARADECTAKGGDYARRGMLGRYSCAVPFADAGKVCTKASDCLGQCRVEDNEATTGTCQKTNDPFGCYTYLDEETGQPVGICVD